MCSILRGCGSRETFVVTGDKKGILQHYELLEKGKWIGKFFLVLMCQMKNHTLNIQMKPCIYKGFCKI